MRSLKNTLCVLWLLFIAASVGNAQRIVSTSGGGNWSSTSTWTGGVVPTSGTSVKIIGPVTLDVDATIGANIADAAPTDGATVTASSTTWTRSVAGFNSVDGLLEGDVLIAGSSKKTVLATPTNSTMTTGGTTTIASPTAYTIKRCALYIVGTAGSLTINAGKTLTLKGHVSQKQSTVTVNAGGNIVFDTSTVAASYWYFSAGEISTFYSSFIVNGSSGTHSAISATGGGSFTLSDNNLGSNMELNYVDMTNCGSASLDCVIQHAVTSVQSFKLNGCTWTNVGRVTHGASTALVGNVVITNNELVSMAASAGTYPTFLRLLHTAGTPTGTRIFTDNVLAVRNATTDTDDVTAADFSIDWTGYTVERNYFARVISAGTSNGTWASWNHNMFVVRKQDSITNWSFVGGGGDTFYNNYFVNDEGAAQSNEHQFMSNDAVSKAGTWTLQNEVLERTGSPISGIGHVVHPGGTSVTTTMVIDGLLVLPSSDGKSSGHVTHRGDSHWTSKIRHSTIPTDLTRNTSTFTTLGGVHVGSSYAGHAGFIAEMKDNLFWTLATPGALAGLGLSYSNASPVADVVTVAGIANNAHYNAYSGTLYDAAGANGTAAAGYNGFRFTTKPTLATDISLGTGSSITTAGPKFLDPTRNLATFDRAYLGNTAGISAWATGQSYTVGTIVYASDASVWGGAVVNYRCVKAHTSNSGNTTNGQPGLTATTSYRTNWELASAYRIRQAILAGTTVTDASLGLTAADYITTLHTWVRRGWAPSNTLLRGTASDGGTPGAVPFRTAQPFHLPAVGGGAGNYIAALLHWVN